MNPRFFLRMSKWARNPPSATQVKIVAFVVIVSLILFAIEYFFGWPEWLTPTKMRL